MKSVRCEGETGICILLENASYILVFNLKHDVRSCLVVVLKRLHSTIILISVSRARETNATSMRILDVLP